jgi:tRNA dimethylallyltransferase
MAERLHRRAPELAARTDLRNPRRVLRALERVEAGGGEAEAALAGPSNDPYPGRVALIGIRRPREVLYRRIGARAAAMFAGGLLAEVAALRDAGFAPDLGPMTGHGYREAAHVLAGEWSVERAVEVTARHTRQYAKRQLSWFRRDSRIVWIDAGERAGNDPLLVDRALNLLRLILAR